MKPKYRFDKLTQERFLPIRSNQVFKNVSNRTIYHNKKAKRLRDELHDVAYGLHRNYLILKKIMGRSKEKIEKKDVLLGAGFIFGIFTSFYSLGNKKYPSVFNYALIPQKEQIKILNTKSK